MKYIYISEILGMR